MGLQRVGQDWAVAHTHTIQYPELWSERWFQIQPIIQYLSLSLSHTHTHTHTHTPFPWGWRERSLLRAFFWLKGCFLQHQPHLLALQSLEPPPHQLAPDSISISISPLSWISGLSRHIQDSSLMLEKPLSLKCLLSLRERGCSPGEVSSVPPLSQRPTSSPEFLLRGH